MSKKRVTLRCEFASELSDSEQKEFVDDVEGWLEGTGINGYFVVNGGRGWIEWEGDGSDVDEKVDDLKNDLRVDAYETVEEASIESTNGSDWYGHTVPDAHASL